MDDPKFKIKLDVSQIETKNDTHPEVKYESQVEGASDIKPSVAYKAEPEIKTKSQLLPLLQEPGVATSHSDYVHLPAPQPAAPIGKTTDLRVAQKEAEVSHGLSFLKKLEDLINNRTNAFPECKEWLETADMIKASAEVPRIPIGVLGYTGSGKSSLINALLDEEMIVPCNAMRASTSVVVEISWNKSQDPNQAYAAEIDFISEEEWLTEFKILTDDIRDRPTGEQLGTKSGSDASMAVAKITAVYPGTEITKLLEMSFEKLRQERDLSEILGQKNRVCVATAKEFYKSIKGYIDSSNKGMPGHSTAYWPLVRLVKIFIKSPLLRHGLVLVDLPGLGDSNAGRANVAESYIKQLRYIWVIADIVRAIDDKVAQDLMGRSFRRQLAMDGRYHDGYVTFVMTKTDQINVQEVINSLDLNDSALRNELEQETLLRNGIEEAQDQLASEKQRSKETTKLMKTLRKEIKTVQGHSKTAPILDRKRKQPGSDVPLKIRPASEDDGPLAGIADAKLRELRELGKVSKEGKTAEANLQQTISQKEKELSSLKLKMKAICIQQRNSYTQQHLQTDFKDGLLELEQELMDTMESRDSQVICQKSISSNNLKAFCVSAKAYQKLCKRFRRENPIEGFSSTSQTSIPQLRNFAMRCTLSDREIATNRTLTELNLLKLSVRYWAEHQSSSSRLPQSRHEQLKKALEEEFEILEKCSSDALRDHMVSVRNCIKTRIQTSLNKSISLGSQGARQICVDITAADMAPNTWKAICRRDGIFSNYKKVSFDWNDAFMKLFIQPLALPWNDVINNDLSRLHDKYSNDLNDSLRYFAEKLEILVASICGHDYSAAKGIFEKLPHLEDQTRGKVSDSLKHAQDTAQETHRSIKRHINKNMRPVYEKCAQESKAGMFNRMKNHLSDHIQNNSQAMYGEASKMVIKKLEKMTKDLEAELTRAGKGSRNRFYKDFDNMITVAGHGEHLELEARRKELQKVMLEELAALDTACSKDTNDLAAHSIAEYGSEGVDQKSDHGDSISDSEDGDSESSNAENDSQDPDEDGS